MRVDIPRLILLSVALLLATHGFGLWQMILLSHTLGVALWMPYITLAVIYLLLMALLALILRGTQWARFVYTVLGIFGLLSGLANAAGLDVSGWLVVAAKTLGLVLLHVPSSNSWFAGSSPNNSFKPNPHQGGA